jgi:hypothetical protein
MGDCRLRSLFFRHDFSAQNLEFSLGIAQAPLSGAMAQEGSTEQDTRLPEDVLWLLKKDRIPPRSALAKELIPEEFPQSSARLSKPNLGICISCVNGPRRFCSPMLSNRH